MTNQLHAKYMAQAVKNRAKVLALRASGMTMQAIAAKVGITYARVQQILAKEKARA